jgi:hypothetical protein
MPTNFSKKKIGHEAMKITILFPLVVFLTAISPFPAKALDTPDAGTSYSYPLPAKAGSLVNVVYTMASSGTVQVMAYNESGDLVVQFTDLKTAGLQTSQIDLCCLAPGVYLYLVSLNYDSGSKQKLAPAKFVVIR